MTLPNEEQNALNNAREFLVSLMNPKQTPKVPAAIRKEAYRLLKHFPYKARVAEAWGPMVEKQEKMFAEFRERDAFMNANNAKAQQLSEKYKDVVVASDGKQFLVYVEKGKKARRAIWDKEYIAQNPHNTYGEHTLPKIYISDNGDPDIKTPWVATESDFMATDWEVFE